jgi:hypothetical protein
MELQEALCYVACCDTRDNSDCGQPAFSTIQVGPCTFAAVPGKADISSKGKRKKCKRQRTDHVWCSLEITDESRAANMDLDVLKLFNPVQRWK